MQKMLNKIALAYRKACVRFVCACEARANILLLVFGLVLLTSGMIQLAVAQAGDTGTWSDAGYDDTLIRNAVGNLFKLIEGAFGALIMVVSGLGAIVAAAMGAYRAAVGMLVVAVGAFILRALVSLFFGTNFEDYVAEGGGQ